jgi:O-antigen ligase
MKNKVIVFLQIALIALAGHFIAYEMFHIPKQAEFTAIFGMCLFYPVIRVPLVGVYAIFALSPFIPFVRRLYYLVYGRPGNDPLIVLGDLIVIMVFIALLFEFRRGLSDDKTVKRFIAFVGFYFVYMIVRAFAFNIAPLGDSLLKLKYYAPVVLMFFMGIYFGQEFKHLKRIWLITVIIGIIGGLYGIKQLFIGYSAAEKLWFSTTYFSTLFIQGVARPFSFYQSPAAFADALVLSIIGVVLFLSWGKFKGNIFLTLLIPLFFYGILITSVRSNWIGALSIFFIWFIVLQMRKPGQRIAIIAAVFIGFVAYQLVDDTVKAHVSPEGVINALNGKLGKQEYVDLMVTSRTKALTNPFAENSMLSRMALWKFLFVLTRDPELALLGRGVGALNADSLYVTYLAEFGYPGFIFIIGLFCAFIIYGIKSLGVVTDPRCVILTKGIIVMDMAFALMNFTGTHIHTFPGDAYFWFWNGVLMNVRLLDKKLVEESAAITA